MNVAQSAYLDLRSLFKGDDGVLLKSLLNSASCAEAGFALELLRHRVTDRTLVAALNLRESLSEMPASPFVMPVDLIALEKIAGLTKRRTSYIKTLSDSDGDFEIEVLGQGNLCYDIVVAVGDERPFFKPGPVAGELITPRALKLVMKQQGLLRAVVELVQDMGIVYNPRFYMSIDDWQFEHAGESLGELTDLF
jgi:hypothetical protein